MSKSQRKVFNGFMKKFSLKSYKDSCSPAVFYSCWGIRNLVKHRSLAIVVWRGTDIVKTKHKLNYIKNMKNVYHVAISSFIMKDLDEAGIPYKFIPLTGADMSIFKPEPLGDEIYTYIPNLYNSKSSGKYKFRYNYNLVKKIKKKCKFKINIATERDQYTRKQMVGIYKRCFCGLRLTNHDGLPNQVIEMGLMGRRNFYNGNIPGSIKWDNSDVIVENIEKEFKNTGKTNIALSQQIKKFIDIGDNWLSTAFWKV